MKPSLADQPFRRILLIKPSSLGDIIHALPVLHALRRRFPSATIDWLISSSFAPLVANHPDLSGVILFDRKKFGQMLVNPAGAIAFYRFLHDLRRRNYDLAIDLQGLFRSGFLALASGAKMRVGFDSAREGARWFYTHRVKVDPLRHAADRNFAVARFLGASSGDFTFALHIDPAAAQRVRQIIENLPLVGKSLVLVAPGARWETKRWDPQRFAVLIDQLQQDFDLACILIGAPEEGSLCDQVVAKCHSYVTNLGGKTDLPTLAALIKQASLLICHDSGPMHLAAALGRPLICLTGPTNPKRTGPYQRENDVIRLDLSCSPCYLKKISACPHQHRCMRELTVQTVLAAAKSRLASPASVRCAAPL